MPGPYAHITLLHELLQSDRLAPAASASGIPAVLANYFPYCALGAVSPDYPNLARNKYSARWAVAMHITRASAILNSGIVRVRNAPGAKRDKLFAWLLGYCAHLVTDVTIHPIVQAKVGNYAENQRQHRICEMHQDSYIYRRMQWGEIGESDTFAATIAQCCASPDGDQLDNDIAKLWEEMLADVHPEMCATQSPDCRLWHREFMARVNRCFTREVRLFPLAGVIADRMELAYPDYRTIDRQYIDRLLVPATKAYYLSYDDIFNHAVGTVAAVWRMVELAIGSKNQTDLSIYGDWNLDNGRDEQGMLVFW